MAKSPLDFALAYGTKQEIPQLKKPDPRLLVKFQTTPWTVPWNDELTQAVEKSKSSSLRSWAKSLKKVSWTIPLPPKPLKGKKHMVLIRTFHDLKHEMRVMLDKDYGIRDNEGFKKLSIEEKRAFLKLLAISRRVYRGLKDIKPSEWSTKHGDYLWRFGTQKAQGLNMLRTHRVSVAGVKEDTSLFQVFPYQMPKFWGITREIFARPAPTRPRHGFVESRVIKSYQELWSLYKEAVAQDPQAEIIIMEKKDALFSGVATNKGVTWGPGNDGATAGKNSVFIPAPSMSHSWNRKMMGTENGHKFGIKNIAYAELVHTKDHHYEATNIVQLRDGPEPPMEVDFIPKETKVREILKVNPKEDLLNWEAIIHIAKKRDGVVVSHVGGSLASHFSVHAIESNIPVICSHEPVIGEVLKPTKTKKHKMTEEDLSELQRLVKKWARKDYIHAGRPRHSAHLIYTMIGTLHSMALWSNAPYLMNLRAFAVVSLARFLHAATAGELRHWHRHGPGRGCDHCPDTPRRTRLYRENSKRDRGEDDRQKTWDAFLRPMRFGNRYKMLEKIGLDFKDPGWSSSYGGGAWGQVADANRNLVKALLLFTREPSAANWQTVAETANTALNTSHNNGLAVTKWIGNKNVDDIALVPTLGFLNPVAARLALGMRLNCGNAAINSDQDKFYLETENAKFDQENAIHMLSKLAHKHPVERHVS